MKTCNVKDAVKDGLPIVMGFLPIAGAFGILSKNAGITALESLAFSMVVFAGASQFIALNLLVAGASIGEIIMTTLLVNFRHFLFAASLSPKCTKDMKKSIPLIAFCLCDEIFSIASLKEKNLSREYMVSLELFAYISLALGTVLGFMLGGILPEIVQLSMGIALYALFVSLLIPEMKKSHKTVLLLFLAGLINTLLLRVIHIPQGWSIFITIIAVSFTGLFIKDNKKEKENNNE